MFSKILGWIRGVIKKMFDKSAIKKQFNVEITISDKMVDNIDLWCKLFENNAPWLDENTKSLNLASAIAGEISRLVTIELESEITGSARADYLNKIYKKFLEDLRINTEYACAKGGIVFKPYVSNNNIAIDVIQANNFYPTEYDDKGKITGGIFISQKNINETYYTRMEYHRFQNDLYCIDNIVFKSTTKYNLGFQTTLKEVPEWSNIDPKVAIEHIDRPLFSYFKIPFANQIEQYSPLGVSVYSRAIDLMKEADKQYSRILWEYEGSELAIDADITMLETNKATRRPGMPKLNDRLFRAVGQNKDSSFYQVFSPTIRDTALFNGLNRLLQKIEFQCGLAYGTLSDPQTVDKTATEVKQSKQRSYASVSDIQKSLENALDDLIYIIDILLTLYNLAPKGEYETSFKWDDSIIIDAEEERTRDAQDVSMGIMSKAEYRAKWYGETLEEAKKNLPQEADVIE